MTQAANLAGVLVVLALGAATGAANAADQAGKGERPYVAKPKGTLTFNKDIAPIIHKNCTFCHRPGEVAPFALIGYRDVQKRGRQITQVTRDRSMPPWKAEPGAAEFIGSRRLSRAQIGLINQWVEEGAPEGDPADAPQLPKFPSGWRLGTPDLVVQMPKPFPVPAEGRDVYPNLVIPVAIPAGKFVKAVEYRPSNRRVVHHAILATATGPTGNGARLGLGIPGSILPGPLGIWAPGRDPLPLPAGFALTWPKDAHLALQLHLHPTGKPEVEQSSIGFYFTSEPPTRPLKMVLMNANRLIHISPGDKAYRVTLSQTLPFDGEVMGLFPHMHLLGKEVKATAKLPDGKEVPLIWIKDWDFSWQTYYQFAAPIKLPRGTRVEAAWTFDNSAENPRNPSRPPQVVRTGEQTTNEMAVLLLDVAPVGLGEGKPVAGAPPPAPAAAERHLVKARELVARFDKKGDGKLGLDELVAAATALGSRATREQIQALLRRFDKDSDGKLNAAELAEALAVAGK